MLYTVKKRKAVLKYVRTCVMGEIPWLVPLQQGVGCGAPSSSRTGRVLGSPFPFDSQHAHQCLTLTQREQIYCTNALQLFSAATVQGMTQVLITHGCYSPDLGVSEEVHVPWPRGLSLPNIVCVFLKWHENPLLCCDPRAGSTCNSPDMPRARPGSP